MAHVAAPLAVSDTFWVSGDLRAVGSDVRPGLTELLRAVERLVRPLEEVGGPVLGPQLREAGGDVHGAGR